MLRDIDYAASAVRRAIEEKFGRSANLLDLSVVAQETTICVQGAGHRAEGSRDSLLAAVRAAATYPELWQAFPAMASR